MKQVVVGGTTVRLAQRRWNWIRNHICKTISLKTWLSEEKTVPGPRSAFWGISPEAEFFLIHALQVSSQLWASPYTALKGVGGKCLDHIHLCGNYRGLDPLDTEGLLSRVVVLFPEDSVLADDVAKYFLVQSWKTDANFFCLL